jgi:DNA-binding LacI/PurR family transcriptional regulator
MAKVTLQSIADRVGVSRMTVSNAFSRPDQLSADLREKILAAAAELGYVGPDPAARALARGRTGSVGLMLNERISEAFEDAVASKFLASVADALATHGLALTLLTRAEGTTFVPARDVAMDGVLVYICEPESRDLACRRSRSTRTSATACPRSTSTTAAAPARPPSTSSTSATPGSASSPSR